MFQEEDFKEDAMMEFKFNCFAKEDMWTSADVFWGPRIEYCVLAQPPRQKCRKCVEKVRPRTKRRPAAHLFHSWIEKRSQRFVIPALSRDVEKIARYCGNNSLSTKLLSDCGNFRRNAHLSQAFRIRDQVVEEPWLLQPPLVSDHFADVYHSSVIDSEREMLKESNGDNQKPQVSNQSRISEDFNHTSNHDMDDKKNSEPCNSLSIYYPVEEPWIFESSTPSVSSTVQLVSGLSGIESDKDEVTQSALDEQNPSTPDSLMHEEESIAMTKEESVSTVILINSSICTIQRIAVLENGKLVELLLEPVKTNVQCDSVYLGVVTKLVPHMGGAFVNIGSPRPSFMDIRTYKEPFVLTSLHDMKERELSGFEHNKSGDKMDFPENGAMSNGFEEPDDVEYDQSEDEFVDDEFEGRENRTDFDVLDVLNENVNGAVVGHEIEVDTERFSEQLNGEVDQLQTKSNQDSTVKVSQLQDVNVKNKGAEKNKWEHIKKGSKIIVQVVKEGLGTKGPTLTAYPKLRSRFWVLMTRCNTIGISKKIFGAERTRLRAIAKTLQPPGFGLTVRTVATGRSLEELRRDLEGLLSTWKSIMDHAKSAALAADEGVDGAVPIILHRAMGQTLSVVQDYFNETVTSMAVDSPRTYHEVTNYLQEIAPNLCERVELYSKRTPLFDEYCIEEEINNILSKRVPLANGGYLVIEQTEALVSIDVNGGLCMLGQGTSQEKAILEVNLAAAKQIARELRLRDVGGIIIVDFIDMLDDSNKRLVYEEVKNAVERDRSTVKVSELSRNGLMEITRKRVRPSVTFMISEPCTCCHATGRVEALETSFSKIEHEICRHLSTMDQKADPENPKSWPRFILNVDRHMCNYLTSGKRTRLAILSSSLKVWILLKVARGLSRGAFELKLLTDENMDKSQQDGAAISVLHPKEAVSYNSPNRKVTIFPIKKWKSGAN